MVAAVTPCDLVRRGQEGPAFTPLKMSCNKQFPSLQSKKDKAPLLLQRERSRHNYRIISHFLSCLNFPKAFLFCVQLTVPVELHFIP